MCRYVSSDSGFNENDKLKYYDKDIALKIRALEDVKNETVLFSALG